MTFVFFYSGDAHKNRWEEILQFRLGWNIIPGTCRFLIEGRSASDIYEVIRCLSDTSYKATVFMINQNEVRFLLN